MLRLWSDILDGLAKAAHSDGSAVASIGVDTWGVDYVLLNKHDEILGQPYNYRDPRTQGVMEHAFTRVPQQEIFATTGLQFMEINTLYQLLSMQLKDPALLAQADRFLMMPDFFHWLLCGSRVVEFTNATTTQCLQRDRARLGDGPAAQVRDPDRTSSRRSSRPARSSGNLREEVAQRTGLSRVPSRRPGHARHRGGRRGRADRPTPARPNWAYISSGTWSLMGVEVQQAVLTRRRRWRSTSRTKGASTARIGC